MTSFIANTTAFVAHQPETVFALLATCRPLMNSSIVPVILSNDELWNVLCTKPSGDAKEVNYLKLFSNFSDTIQFTESLKTTLIAKNYSNRYDDNDVHFFEEILLDLIKTKRYFARTVQHISVPDVRTIPKIAGKLSNIRSIRLPPVSNFTHPLDDTLLKLLCENFTLLRTLDLSRQNDITSVGLSSISNLKMLTEIDFTYSDITDIQFLNSCKNLRKLNLYGCHDLSARAFETIIDDDGPLLLPSLLEINMEAVSYAATDGCIELLQRHAPKLVSLACGWLEKDSYTIISKITTLQKLKMYDCENLTEDCVEEMMLKLVNLDSLSIRFGKLLNERCMRLISESVAPIRVLELHCCDEVDNAGFRDLTSMQNLETLSILACEGDQSFTSDDTRFPNKTLKNLNFHQCSDLTGAGLVSMTKGLSSLKSLKLQQCGGLTSDCLESAFKENSNILQSLEVLDLGDSYRITSLQFLQNYHLVSLKTLILSDLPIQDDDIVNITSSDFNYKNNLKTLGLSGCSRLTDRAITEGASVLTNLENIYLGSERRTEREMFSFKAIVGLAAAKKRKMKTISVGYYMGAALKRNQEHDKNMGHLFCSTFH